MVWYLVKKHRNNFTFTFFKAVYCNELVLDRVQCKDSDEPSDSIIGENFLIGQITISYPRKTLWD